MQEEIINTPVDTPVEKIYEYQPTDSEGRPIGGRQVIKYFTAEELADKLREQNVLLIRKLREETKKNRLGIVENEELPDDIQRFSGLTEFNPRELTDEEKYEVSRKLQDPITAFEAIDTILQAKVGAPLEGVGTRMNQLEQDNLNLRAKIEANAFVADNPDYYKCSENFESITSWMVRYNLAPTKANYQKAYDTLKAQGVIILGPAPEPAPVVVAPVVVEPVQEVIEEIPAAPAPVEYPRVPVALSRTNSSDHGTPVPVGSDITYEIIVNGQKRVLSGLQAVNAMPGDEYKRRLLRDKEFSKKVEKLEAEARKPRV